MIVWRADPTKLNTAFRRDVEAVLTQGPHTWYVLSGYRSNLEQADLYRKHLAGGPRAAPPGRSAHNFGLAVDVVPDVDDATPGLQPSWDVKHEAAWTWLAATVDWHPRLKHGRVFGDWPHIERRDYRKYITAEAA